MKSTRLIDQPIATRPLRQLLIIAMLCTAISAWSGPFEEGLTARDRGDFSTAFSTFKQLATSGDARSQLQLSLLYSGGQGAEVDHKQAIYWLRQAATRGNTQAQSNLGVAFNRGRGVPQNSLKAYAWLSMANASGDRMASTNLDVVARKLTPLQLEQAKGLARNCRQGNYIPCL